MTSTTAQDPVAAFIEAHGGKPVVAHATRDGGGGITLLPDGASIDSDMRGTRLNPPPENPQECATRRLRYRAERLRAAEIALKQFETFPTAETGSLVSGTGPSWNARDLGEPPLKDGKFTLDAAIERLKVIVRCRREAFGNLRAEIFRRFPHLAEMTRMDPATFNCN